MLQRLVMFTALAIMAGFVSAAELSADDVVAKAYHVDGGRDGVARLTFTFQKNGAPEKKLVYTMVWKRYEGEGGVDSKVIFFSEFPPADQGKAYLGYIYSDDRMDDGWIYLPELRMVRKMSHEHHHHDDDDFAHSDLTRGDLAPRKPTADTHRLMGDEDRDGRVYYVVASVPKEAADDEEYPYSRTVKWISKDNFLTEQIDYYRGGDKVEKTARIQWKRIGDNWVWERVTAEDFKKGSRTVLTVSDVRINLRLKDQAFSSRSLRNGLESVLR